METKFEEVEWAARIFYNSWQHAKSNETCSWCNTGKITSGLFVEYNFTCQGEEETTGSPCCQDCYRRIDGFNVWFATQEYNKIPKKISEHIKTFLRRSELFLKY